MEALRKAEAAGSRSSAREVDQHVGRRLRDRRILLGLTQHELAECLGISFQQTHKYEKGTNRIAAGRLFEIAHALGVTVDYFFEGLDRTDQRAELPMTRKIIALVRNFNSIQDRDHQLAIYRMAKLFSQDE